jgi:hypothetical protein
MMAGRSLSYAPSRTLSDAGEEPEEPEEGEVVPESQAPELKRENTTDLGCSPKSPPAEDLPQGTPLFLGFLWFGLGVSN